MVDARFVMDNIAIQNDFSTIKFGGGGGGLAIVWVA